MSAPVRVVSPNVEYSDTEIVSKLSYHYNKVIEEDETVCVVPQTVQYTFRTERKVPKLGIMIVGLGGNNGSTVTAGIIANREGISWRTKKGVVKPNFYGSLTQCATMRLGYTDNRTEVNATYGSLVPMVKPTDLEIGGWDISSMNLAKAMERAGVLEYDLQRQLEPYMSSIVPLPSIYFPDFIAANQSDRADNVVTGKSKMELVEHIRGDIRAFKARTGVDKVIVLWSATTERFAQVAAGLNDTAANLMAAVAASHEEVSPSTVFAIASVLEGCSYINGSPQNTLVPGLVDLAKQHRVFVAGDDFKSGQTKFKSVLADFLVGAGLKLTSVVSYNHLGNNDGKNLSSPAQFRSKEITKTNVIDDVVEAAPTLYAPGERPDHCVVIKYVPYVGDSKRALDEYTSEIFMGGTNTIVTHNTCEDSLLAAPLILDLAILCELFERVTVESMATEGGPVKMHSILSVLSYLLKAPAVPENTPLINALFRQKYGIENILRALVGMMPEDNMLLEYKLPSSDKIAPPLADPLQAAIDQARRGYAEAADAAAATAASFPSH